MDRIYRTYVNVDTEAIRHNGRRAKQLFPGCKIITVLKADAYGHGIAGVVPACDEFSDWYAVATVDEGARVRECSSKPVLLFGPVPDGRMIEAARLGLTFTVGSVDYAARLSAHLEAAGLTADCHLKIDTGLNRTGIRWRGQDDIDQIFKVHSFSALHFSGTYTHFACGEGMEPWETAFTAQQFERFKKACAAMERKGLPVGMRHCCSTGGSLVHPEYRLDAVRLGMLPLGMSYSDESVHELNLKPALEWVTYIAQIEEVGAGEAISYGCTFYAPKPMRIGILTCGYADGYRRTYSNRAQVLVGGKRVPVLGRVAMDYMMIDLTDADAQIGDAVLLLGGEDGVSAQELSAFGESVSGEVTCAISARVPRIYTKG